MIRDVRRTGQVQLRSGTWDWSAHDAAGGTRFLFRHRRHRDELRAWTPETNPPAEQVAGLAREALLRVCEDAVGLEWSVGVELVGTTGAHARSSRSADPAARRLVFSRGGTRRTTLMPNGLHLGDLTRSELLHYLSVL